MNDWIEIEWNCLSVHKTSIDTYYAMIRQRWFKYKSIPNLLNIFMKNYFSYPLFIHFPLYFQLPYKIIIILLTIYNSGSTKQYFAIYMKWNTLNSNEFFIASSKLLLALFLFRIPIYKDGNNNGHKIIKKTTVILQYFILLHWKIIAYLCMKKKRKTFICNYLYQLNKLQFILEFVQAQGVG